jgi:ABC-type phosphate transport system substrate-binding protein
MKQLSLGLIAAAALAGCASNSGAPATQPAQPTSPAPATAGTAAPAPASAKMIKTAMEESARLPAPSTALSAYGKFELKPMVMSDAVQREAGKVQAAQQLDATVRARVEPLLAEWAANGRGGKTLVIQPRVESIRIIGGANRFFAGALAGDSHIDMDLELKDAATGMVIAKPRVSRSSNAMAGGWSVGATDRNLPNYMAEIWRQYLSDSYKKQ